MRALLFQESNSPIGLASGNFLWAGPSAATPVVEDLSSGTEHSHMPFPESTAIAKAERLAIDIESRKKDYRVQGERAKLLHAAGAPISHEAERRVGS